MEADRPLSFPLQTRLAITAAVGAGALVLCLVGLLVADGSLLVWSVPVALGGGLALALARPSPLTQLGAVLASSALLVGGGRGLEVSEVFAGLVLVGYLGTWYGRAVLRGHPFLTSVPDMAAALWLFGFVPLAVAMGVFYGPDAYDFRADLLATIPFALYFPVKEAAAQSERGTLVVAVGLAWLGGFSAISNGLALQSVVASADAAWQIADARFIMGETSITAGLLLSLAALTVVKRRSARVACTVATGAFLAALIMTRSRGFWVSAALGLAFLWLVAPGRARVRIAVYMVLGLTAVFAVALALFPQELALLADGTIRRFVTLSTASTRDVSLVNRFAETAAAWERIRVNPILGYGWGVQVTRYDMVSYGTQHWAFLHNGYVALWFKTGLFGLVAVLTVWIGGLFRGALASRNALLAPASRACALGGTATLVALSLASVTSNPFSILDQMLVVTLLMGLTNGVADRALAATARLRRG
jgi:O-antigen ligase